MEAEDIADNFGMKWIGERLGWTREFL